MLMKVLFDRGLNGIELLKARAILCNIKGLVVTEDLGLTFYRGYTYAYMEVAHAEPLYGMLHHRLKGMVTTVISEFECIGEDE